MAKPQPVIDPISALLSEFSTRLNELEEKQKLLKDRALLIGENLIKTKEEYEKNFSDIKKQVSQLIQDVKDMKRLDKRIVNDLSNFARRSELEILERQSKIFQPLEFARMQDVKTIIEKELSKHFPKKKK